MQIPRYLARAVHSAGEDRAGDEKGRGEGGSETGDLSISQPGRRKTEQLYHINLLKKWVGTRDQLVALASTEPVVVDTNPHLSAAQKGELQHLIGQFSDVFSPLRADQRHPA